MRRSHHMIRHYYLTTTRRVQLTKPASSCASLMTPIDRRLMCSTTDTSSNIDNCNNKSNINLLESSSATSIIRRNFATTKSKRSNNKIPKGKKAKGNNNNNGSRSSKKHKKGTGTNQNHQIRHKRPPKLKKDTSPQQAPPLFIYPTASPTVYIASIAIDNMNEQGAEDDEQTATTTMMHPKSFFTETTIPQSFTNSTFEYVSPKLFNHELPTNPKIPEVAFLGRSNVGKSSLLNAITGDSQLARISKTPGRTQQVNYFGQFRKGMGGNSSSGSIPPTSSDHGGDRDVNSTPPFGYIIDLPGYGYAQAPDNLVDQWQKNTQDFIVARKEFGTLERLYMLIDSKRGIGVIDSTIMGWLDEANVNYTVVLTKSDSTTKPMLIKGANEICMRYHTQMNDNEVNEDIVGCQSPFVHVTSSRKGVGVVDLMYAIESDFYGFHSNEW